MDRSHVEIFNYFICYTCLNYRRTDKIYNNYYSDSATRPAFGRPVPRFCALCPSKHSLKVGRSASSIFDLVPCLQSVGISSGLPVLRSASAELFSVPFSQTVRHGDRRFSVAVATLWNQLPNSVRMIETLPLFRTHLKTHLFRVAFS